MKTKYIRTLLVVFSLAIMLNGFAQNDTKVQHPFQMMDKDIEVLTLSNGKYNEFFDTDSIEIIGDAIFNVNTKKVIGFVEYDTTYSEATMLPEITSRWLSPDPEARTYPEVSPYNFVVNSPIQFIDPAGTVVVDPKTGEQVVYANGKWETISGGDVSKQFIKNSQPVLDKLVSSEVGTKLYEQLQSVRTKVSIDLSDKPNLQALKNGGNSKLRTGDGQFTTGADGLYNDVVITPNLDKIEASANADNIDFEEKLIQTISVETGHLSTAEQIAKEKSYDFNLFSSPTVVEDVYGPLLQDAVTLGIQYRQEKGQKVDESSNLPINRVNQATGSKIPTVPVPK